MPQMTDGRAKRRCEVITLDPRRMTKSHMALLLPRRLQFALMQKDAALVAQLLQQGPAKTLAESEDRLPRRSRPI